MTSIMLIALLLRQAPTPLTFADVKAGDFLEYQVSEKRQLELFACEVNDQSVRLALQVRHGDGHHSGAVLDGVLVDVPRARLSPPPKRAEPTEESGASAAGHRFPVCATWTTSSMHGPNTKVVRCEARELILGGGLVSESSSSFSIRGESSGSSLTLTALGTREAPHCPEWPVAKLDGWYRELSVDQNEASLVELRYTAGSAWLRITEQAFEKRAQGPVKAGGASWRARGKPSTGDVCLVEAVIAWARSLPAGEPNPVEHLSLGDKPVSVRGLRVSSTGKDALFEEEVWWATADALDDAPLAARATPVRREWKRTSSWSGAQVTRGEVGLAGWGGK